MIPTRKLLRQHASRALTRVRGAARWWLVTETPVLSLVIAMILTAVVCGLIAWSSIRELRAPDKMYGSYSRTAVEPRPQPNLRSVVFSLAAESPALMAYTDGTGYMPWEQQGMHGRPEDATPDAMWDHHCHWVFDLEPEVSCPGQPRLQIPTAAYVRTQWIRAGYDLRDFVPNPEPPCRLLPAGTDGWSPVVCRHAWCVWFEAHRRCLESQPAFVVRGADRAWMAEVLYDDLRERTARGCQHEFKRAWGFGYWVSRRCCLLVGGGEILWLFWASVGYLFWYGIVVAFDGRLIVIRAHRLDCTGADCFGTISVVAQAD